MYPAVLAMTDSSAKLEAITALLPRLSRDLKEDAAKKALQLAWPIAKESSEPNSEEEPELEHILRILPHLCAEEKEWATCALVWSCVRIYFK
jgi:hypothetical protein